MKSIESASELDWDVLLSFSSSSTKIRVYVKGMRSIRIAWITNKKDPKLNFTRTTSLESTTQAVCPTSMVVVRLPFLFLPRELFLHIELLLLFVVAA